VTVLTLSPFRLRRAQSSGLEREQNASVGDWASLVWGVRRQPVSTRLVCRTDAPAVTRLLRSQRYFPRLVCLG
jgi:hypothetical protein